MDRRRRSTERASIPAIATESPAATMDIRDETPDDHDAIREVNRLAFGGEVEACLIDQLRTDGLVIASLVAVEASAVVGHILFTALPINTDYGVIPAAVLAPLAVAPARQRQGIGSALVRRGLDVCRERGRAAVVVLGHPGYYLRFGFSAALARGFRAPYAGEAFMALELTPGALAAGTGDVRYPDAFKLVD